MGKYTQGMYFKGNTSTHKNCPKCGIKKERSEFHKDKTRNDGLAGFCKPCLLQKTQKWRNNNPEELLQSQRRTRRKREYGVTREDYNKMLLEQNNECAICQISIGHEASVDHDHDTGQVRGLLCRNCNVGIGMLQDNSKILKSATKYLEKYGK
jgi:Recombination endonuclease VII